MRIKKKQILKFMTTDLQTIKQLRSETGAGMVDVKKALDEASGDVAKAKDLLRKRGLKIAAKKQARETSQGLIDTYIHPPGRIAAVVVLLSETDFVARNSEFKTLAHDIAKQIAAMSPQYLKPEDIPTDELTREKDIYKEQLTQQPSKKNPDDKLIDKILEGKLQKYYEQVCLLEQPWITDDKKKIKN